MSDSFVQPPANTGVGKKVRTLATTVNSQLVDTQVVANSPIDGFQATFCASILGLNVGTSATTDIFTIFGSASKLVKVTRLQIMATIATAAALFDVLLSKRSAATTAGTPVAGVVIPLDSTNAAGTALVKGYSAAPTAGAALGNVGTAKLYLPITGTPSPLDRALVFEFGNRPGQAIALRGVAQGLALTLNGATPADVTSWDINVEWTEE